MTRVLRTLGIPVTVLVLAACGSHEVGGGGTSSPADQPPASSTPSTPSTSSTPSTPSPSSATPTGTSPATGLPTPSGPAASPTFGRGPHGPDPSRADFPLTLARRGGIAGFKDTVRLQADGTATVERRGSAPARCRVDARLMEHIRAALDAVSWPAPGAVRSTPPGKMSDQMFVTVTSGRHHASLDDPGLGKLAGPLGQLLGDITQPAAQRSLCTPL